MITKHYQPKRKVNYQFETQTDRILDSLQSATTRFNISQNRSLFNISDSKYDQSSFMDFQNNQYQNGSTTQRQIQQQLKDQEENKNYYAKMQSTIFPVIKDKNPDDIYGEGSVHSYYMHYKQINKIVQQNEINHIKDSPQTSLLQNFDNKKMLPSKLGLVKEKGNKNQLSLKNMNYGDSYINILTQGLKSSTNIKEFNLKANRITSNSSDSLLKHIGYHAVTIDLSQNKIGNIGCEHISRALRSKDSNIQYLNLEENLLGNKAIILILNSIIDNRNSKLSYLNLSKNFLSDEIAEYIKQMLEKRKIEELYLHWNTLKGDFGKIVFPILNTENKQLRVLDVSNNSLGKGESCISELCQVFEQNEYIVHLDLSFNYFNFQDTKALANSLIKNKTIYGFHFAGNAGYVDTRGFIVPEEIANELTGTVSKRRINGIEATGKTMREAKNQFSKEFQQSEIRNSCWICDGWNEVNIVWSKFSGSQPTDPLFVHLDFEYYNPCYYGKQGGLSLNYLRMVPQGYLNYFFSNDLEFFSDLNSNRINNNLKFPEIYNFEGNVVPVELPNINQKIIKKPQLLLDKNNDYSPNIEVKPRTRDPVYVPPKKKKQKVKWSFPISLMSKWRSDDAELVNLCFEYDWECSKVPKIIKDEQQLFKTKEFYRERYKFIKDTYKYFASTNPIGDIWAVQNASFIEVVDKCGIIDQKLTLEFINIKWTAVISGTKGASFQSCQQIFNTPEKKQLLSNNLARQVDRKDGKLGYEELQKQKKIKDSKKQQNKQKYQTNDKEIKEASNSSYSENDYMDDDDDKRHQQQHQISNVQYVQPEFKNRRQSNFLRKLSSVKSIDFLTQLSSLTKESLCFITDKKESLALTNKHIIQLSSMACDSGALQSGKNPRNPERGINRYQMIEALTRIAEEKYINIHQKTKDYFEAVQMLWEENLVKEFVKDKYDSQTWRQARFWNEECDYCLKFYKRIVEHVYKKFAVRKVKPGQQPFMCLEELNMIIVQCGLNELEWFGSNNYLFAFNNSMMTQVDELGSDRIFQMSLIEFYEALGRIAEEACIEPGPGIYEDSYIYNLEQRRILPLGQKLEGLILRLLDTCCDLAFKNSYPRPQKSFFWVNPDESDYDMV